MAGGYVSGIRHYRSSNRILTKTNPSHCQRCSQAGKIPIRERWQMHFFHKSLRRVIKSSNIGNYCFDFRSMSKVNEQEKKDAFDKEKTALEKFTRNK